MNPTALFRTMTLFLPKPVNWSPLRHGLVLIALVLTWFVLSPSARGINIFDGDAGDGTSTGEGAFALPNLTTGLNDTAIGALTLNHTTSGNNNTATGAYALVYNTIANDNTAVGFQALQNNDNDGSGNANYNTATGSGALEGNTTHSYNTATGFQALNVADADDNTAMGALALSSDTSGYYNTATGVSSLFSNTTGYHNVANGLSALYYNVAGHDNVAIGSQALLKNKGSNNIAVGSNAGNSLTTGSNNIDIGAPGTAGEANAIRIGKQGTQKSTFVAGVFGTAVTGTTVVVNSTGKLGVATSSARFKEAIKPMGTASEAILALKPVTFRYKEEVDPDRAPQFGLVAEDVEKVNPGLVVRGEDGKVMTVRYEAVNAMLLNEFLKEHQKVEKQAGDIAQMKKQIEALTATVQKVVNQGALSKAEAQLVANNQ